MRAFSIILMSLFIFSCQEEIELDNTDFTPQVYVESIISSGSSMRVNIGETKPLGATYDSYTRNADVKIFDATLEQFIPLEFHSNGDYISNVEAVDGHDYDLYISVPGYDPISSSTCIPKNINVGNESLVMTYNTLNELETIEINVEIENDPDVEDFYSMEVFSYQAKVEEQIEVKPPVVTTNEQPSLTFAIEKFDLKGLNIFSDTESPGSSINANIKILKEDFGQIRKEIEDEDSKEEDPEEPCHNAEFETRYYVKIVAVSEDLFNFLKSQEINNYHNNLVPVTSHNFNIDGGAGIFGGENVQIIYFDK